LLSALFAHRGVANRVVANRAVANIYNTAPYIFAHRQFFFARAGARQRRRPSLFACFGIKTALPIRLTKLE
jgi:hypothetical protein